MKITTFNPQIITKTADSLIQIFEALGFTKRHHQEDIGEENVTGIRMKDENGFYVDISEVKFPIPHDLVSIRIDVDSFEEANDLLVQQGFKSFYGDHASSGKHSKYAVMFAPSGFCINLVQHIKT